MKSLLLACVLSLFASVSHAQDTLRLVQRTALGGAVTLMAPDGFGPMSPALVQTKYPSERRPTEVLTNPETTINIAFGHSSAALAPAEIRAAHPVIEAQLKATYPTARWNRSEVVKRDGRDYIVFDLWSPALDTEIRNIMLGTSVGGRFLMVSFNVTRDREAEWGPIGERIMDSIRVIE
jgi:hypothetical protein